jgi:hypothetical protein
MNQNVLVSVNVHTKNHIDVRTLNVYPQYLNVRNLIKLIKYYKFKEQ